MLVGVLILSPQITVLPFCPWLQRIRSAHKHGWMEVWEDREEGKGKNGKAYMALDCAFLVATISLVNP